MRRFTITSKHFKGECELMYDETGLLCYIDCRKLIASSNFQASLLTSIPVGIHTLLEEIKYTNKKDLLIEETQLA